MHIWPLSGRLAPSRWPVQDVLKQLRIRSNISTLYRTYDTLISLAPIKVLERDQNERAKLEGEIRYDVLRTVQPESSVEYIVETVFLPLYSSLDDAFLSVQEGYSTSRGITSYVNIQTIEIASVLMLWK